MSIQSTQGPQTVNFGWNAVSSVDGVVQNLCSFPLTVALSVNEPGHTDGLCLKPLGHQGDYIGYLAPGSERLWVFCGRNEGGQVIVTES